MSLYDGDTEKREIEKRKKMKKVILSSIIISCLLIFVILGLIIYMAQKPEAISININGKANSDLLQLITVKADESGIIELDKEGSPIIYGPIKKLAQYFGYKDYNGNYMTISEDTNSCNVKNEKEVAIFSLDSDFVYKKDLTNKDSIYETYKISETVFQSENELYTNRQGLELAFNSTISYNKKTNSIDIYTLDYYISYYNTENETTQKKPIQDLGYSELSENFVNQKAILDDMFVVQNEQGNYGVITSRREVIFGDSYESITYIPDIEAFLLQSNGKYGISSISGENRTKPKDLIPRNYDSLKLIDNEKQLYLVSNYNKFGIIDINNKTIVPLEYDKIGIENINQFAQNNLTNKYIIQNTLIPVQQEQKWGFFNLDGNIVGKGIIYDNLGCVKKGTAYNVLSIPKYNSIVICKDEKYGCINLEGEVTLPCKTDEIYMKVSTGETKYYFVHNGKTIDIAEKIRNY